MKKYPYKITYLILILLTLFIGINFILKNLISLNANQLTKNLDKIDYFAQNHDKDNTDTSELHCPNTNYQDWTSIRNTMFSETNNAYIAIINETPNPDKENFLNNLMLIVLSNDENCENLLKSRFDSYLLQGANSIIDFKLYENNLFIKYSTNNQDSHILQNINIQNPDYQTISDVICEDNICKYMLRDKPELVERNKILEKIDSLPCVQNLKKSLNIEIKLFESWFNRAYYDIRIDKIDDNKNWTELFTIRANKYTGELTNNECYN